MEEEVAKIETEGAEQLNELEKEISEQKKNMLPTMSGEDVDKFMKELQRQEEAKRKAISDQVRGRPGVIYESQAQIAT